MISHQYWCGVESLLFERLEDLAEKSASREKHIRWCLEQTQQLATQVKTKLQNDENEWKDKAEQLSEVQLAVAKLERSIDLAAESIVKAVAVESESVQPKLVHSRSESAPFAFNNKKKRTCAHAASLWVGVPGGKGELPWGVEPQ